MHLASAILSLLASASLAWADVKFSAPAAGGSFAAATPITVTWADSGVAPALSALSTYTLFLFSGSNAVPAQLYSLQASTAFTAGSTISVTIPAGVGGTGTNAYFLGMLSVATAGGTVWNYSPRFTLTGMTGTFTPTVAAQVLAISGTVGPDTVNNVAVAGAQATAATAAGDPLYAVPYNMQTGPIRYAPMQPVPPTAITKTNTSPQWPTSAVAYAATFLPVATIATTLTQANTYSISSRVNTGAAASQPSDDMAKFLARWKD